MLIRNVSADKAINLLREWNGQVSGGRTAESEKAFRDMCDRYLLVEVESAQELSRLNSMEKYLTAGHGFYLYVRYPSDVLDAIRAGRAALPEFVHRAEQRYSSAYSRGTLKLLLGFIQEAMDPNFDFGLFIDIMDEQKKAKERERLARQIPVYQPPVQQVQQTYQPPVQQPQQVRQTYQPPVQQQAPQVQQTYQPQPQQVQQTYQPPVQQPRRRTTNVVHYHFGNQVS